MELINDNKQLLRLAVVLQLDLEDLILNLKYNYSPAAEKTARADFLRGVSSFLENAMVSPTPVKSPAVNSTTAVVRLAPVAPPGSVPSVDALSQSMAATSLPDHDDDGSDDDDGSENDDGALSDADTEVATNVSGSSTPTNYYSATSIGNPAAAQEANGNATADAVRPLISAPQASNKRGREDDDGEEEEDGEYKEEEEDDDDDDDDDDEEEVKQEGGEDDDNAERASGKKTGPGGRKYRKIVHPHSCQISCGESMRIDE